MTPDESMRWVEEMDYWRAAISYESLSALMDLQSDREQAKGFRGRDDFSPEDFHRSIDEALKQALKVARKTARSDLKAAMGEWALRKLRKEASAA